MNQDNHIYEKYFKFEKFYEEINSQHKNDYINYKNNMFDYDIDSRVKK
jgi:hypothetical protein